MPVFDATALLHFLEPDASAPVDPATNEPVTDAKARIDFLIETLDARRETIVIPTPTLSEVLVHAGEAGPRYLEILNGTRCFRIEPFDQRAAVELAAMTRDAIAAGDLRAGTDATRAKLKFDNSTGRSSRSLGRKARRRFIPTTAISPSSRRRCSLKWYLSTLFPPVPRNRKVNSIYSRGCEGS